MSASSSNLQLWKEYRIPLVCMAIGIATISILISNRNNTATKPDSDQDLDTHPSDKKDKQLNKVEEIVHDMEQDPAIPDLSQAAVNRVVDHATEEQKPYQHQGLKKEVYRKLPKVIRKKPKKKQAELDAAADRKSVV